MRSSRNIGVHSSDISGMEYENARVDNTMDEVYLENLEWIKR